MKGQPNRLISDGQSPFAGTDIDRGSPLSFRLNGRTLYGFAGDTVLTAALAAGIDTVGIYRGFPLALSARFAPALIDLQAPRGAAPLPMERTPATDGADYRTMGTRLRRPVSDAVERLRGASRTLGLNLDDSGGLSRPWISGEAEAGLATDIVVIGGGVAGLAAAIAGAEAGFSVRLLESSLHLGGHARLFGTQDGEEPPGETIARLRAAVANTPAITVCLDTEAFALREGLVRTHAIAAGPGRPQGRVIDYPADRIVLATGAIEQLPVFPGNRLPGTMGAAEAYALAHRHAIWPGKLATLATVSSPAYRLTMQAKDAGITIARVMDGRPDPQSRFVAFSKAYGITMAGATMPARVHAASKGRGIAVTPKVALAGLDREEPELLVDRLLLCGGWQPDLTLWHMAGGQSRWVEHASRIEPQGMLRSIALAGSAAGYLSRQACLDSGLSAIAALTGSASTPVIDHQIDPLYETPDGPAPLAERRDGEAPAYLGNGHSLLDRPIDQPSRWPSWLPMGRRTSGWQLAETPHPLEITDITAGVRLRAIPSDSAGIVAQERVAMVALPTEVADHASDGPDVDTIPPYLAGRYGADAELWIVAATDHRRLDTGALVYRDADDTNPLQSTGVIVRPGEGAALALLSAGQNVVDGHASLRDNGRAIALRLVAPYKPGMKLVAPLRSEASPA
jgi:sarcosine oxidase subunit alpha